ncbi:MAG TPA: glucose 1-dehydrogenase [Acidobacteriota bacterium]|jgi:NAD(P)-dependent dehydrogenase (short-subunit alcohol dehydrogenase family)
MERLENKTTIVTGGAHGIGRAICEVYAREGAFVYMVDVDQEAGSSLATMIRDSGGKACFVAADVSVATQVRQAVRGAAEKTGRIDVLCNNAAYLGAFHDLLGAAQEEWQRTLDVTLLGTSLFTREVLPYMIDQNWGSIINIASVQGMVGARNSVAYTTAKAGLLGLTRSVAYDYGKHNIRVNAICPGPIQTRISPRPGEELYQRQVNNTFLQRVGQPHEVAYAALFLASDESSFITGAVLPVDGGWTAM